MKFYLKKIFYLIDKYYSYFRINLILKKIRKKNKKIKLIIGSASTNYKGWIKTNIYSLNLLDTKSFKNFFNENEIDNILAEHVFEHLSLKDGLISTNNIYKFLKKGGNIRIAVPDGNFKNQNYLDSVKPGGSGPGAHDHKVLYNYELIKKIIDTSKYSIDFLEYFDERGNFIEKNWSIDEGFVQRSKKYDRRNKSSLNYTSLIVDLKKK